MLVAYTLGKSMDDASGFFTSAGDPNFPQDSDNLDAEWGRSSFDVRHRLSVSFSYDLPFDFTISGIVQMQSGRPFTVALLPEVDNSNTGRSSLGFGGNDRPNVSGSAAAERSRTESVVQHGGILDARVRDVWKRRPEHSRGARLSERESRAAQARAAARAARACSCARKHSIC